MPSPLLLPFPLVPGSVALGQLLVDPLKPDSPSFTCSTAHPALNQPTLQSHYQDVLSQDDHGRFLSSLSDRSLSPHKRVLLVQADNMSYSSLKSPRAAFDALRRDAASQSFLRKMALRHQPLYYVAGIQKLTHPSFKKAIVKEGSIAEAQDSKIRLPMHVRRDSGINLEDDSDDAIFAVDLRKVCCHVGASDEPHSLEDIDYEWSYHKLDGPEELQLSIGLGRPLEAAELRNLAGIVSDEDFTDDNYDVDSSEDEGLAGF